MDMNGIELNDLPWVYSAALCLRNFLYEYKNFLSGALLVGGYDNFKGYQLYMLTLGGTIVQ